MKKEKHVLINNIHRYFGVEFNNTTFDYFDKKKRTPEENDEMIGYAHSSLLHWKLYSGGTKVNEQRGEYMVAKAYALAGKKAESLIHANKCLKITKDFSDEMKDFDFAFANEVMALAYKLNGDMEKYKKHKALALKITDEIKDKGDRDVCIKDFKKSFNS
ncbi:MAG TPA: hypothetical protein PKC58_09465 [Ignavibacteria bacterium]|nr:hypothetical protein [Ignavibacteria bacterium]